MRKTLFGIGVVVLAALAIAWKSAPATVSPGEARNVVGSAVIDGVGTVEVRGFTAGVTVGTGVGGGGGIGKAKFDPFTIVKPMDSASGQLFARTVGGQHIASVAISIAGKGIVYKLGDCTVTAFRPSATGATGDVPYEEVSFACAKVELSTKA
jgi:type VI protein secretion system component Hcp